MVTKKVFAIVNWKVGYILSCYKNEFKLSKSFFNTCLIKGDISNRGYLLNSKKIISCLILNGAFTSIQI